MALVVRIMMGVGGAAATLLLAPSSPNFPVVQGLLAIGVGAAMIVLTGLLTRR